jgi:hypothetical protein
MRDHLAEIRAVQVPVVQVPTVLLLRAVQVPIVQVLAVQVPIVQVLAVRLVALHLHHQDRLVQIANVAVKIYRLVAVHPIALAQLVRFRKGVKLLIHAGFVPSR